MYSSIFDLPSQVRNSLDETDQKVWMDTYNRFDPQSADEAIMAYRKAWHACAELPSSFSFKIKASVDAIDKDREVIDLASLKKHIDSYINGGGPVQWEHGSYNVGCIYDWEPTKVKDMDAIEVYGNVYGGSMVYDNMRKAFIKGYNSLSVAGEADGGKYVCDEKGCYIKRTVKQLLEISLCKVPANKYCTMSWYHENDKIAKSASSDELSFHVEEYEIHKSYTECPFLRLKRALEDIGYDAHATYFGVTVPMAKSEFEQTLPYMKSCGLHAIWSDGEALINDRDYLIELSYKDGIDKGYLSPDGRVLKSITKSQFEMLVDRDVLYSLNGELFLEHPSQ